MIYTLKQLTNSKYFQIFLTSILFVNVLHAQTDSVSIKLPKPSNILMHKWQQFNKRAGKGLQPFAEKYLSEATQDIKTVFYPFGGPDATFPILLFPSTKHFIIVGLEYPGDVESLKNLVKSEKLHQKSITQVDSLYRRSFFITSEMSKQFSKETGIAAPLFLQLSLLGVKKITIQEPDLPYPGIKITFKHDGRKKTIQYYRLDLSNQNIPKKFLCALKKKKLIDGCMIKSSSYIPHQSNFTKIRDFITENASVIIQDDTGIPIKFLKDDFKVHMYGEYKGPYGREFKGYKQKDMPKMEKQVPFCFGYGCRAQNSILMLALKESE